MHDVKDFNVPTNPYDDEVEVVLIDEEELHVRIAEMTHRVNKKYKDANNDLILVAVPKGTVSFLAGFARQFSISSQVEFTTVSGYRNPTSSSGMVRILKGPGRDIEGCDVVIVEDITDSDLTLSWLMKNLHNRDLRSLEVITLLRKLGAVRTSLDVTDVGFDIPNRFVIGHDLDYAKHYRDLPYIGMLHPRAYQGQVCPRCLLYNTDTLRRILRMCPPAILAGFQL